MMSRGSAIRSCCWILTCIVALADEGCNEQEQNVLSTRLFEKDVVSLLQIQRNYGLAAAPFHGPENFTDVNSPGNITDDGTVHGIVDRLAVEVLGTSYSDIPPGNSTIDQKPNPKPAYKVQHVSMLKNSRFWMLMGAIIFSMSLVVLKMETEEGGSHKENESSSRSWTERSWTREIEGNPWLHLGFCCFGLQASMIFWGVAQEYVMTQLDYSEHGGVSDRLDSASFPILWNRFFSMTFFAGVMALRKERFFFDGFRMSALPAMSNGLASWCQYDSLKFVPFAVQTTAKTTKLLPVVLLNTLRGKPQTVLDYAEAITLVAAMVVFGVETTGGVSLSATVIGVILLVVLVAFDSLTPHFQDMIFESNPKLTTSQLMFSTAFFSLILIFIAQLVMGTLFPCVAFVYRHPDAMLLLTLLAASSVLTQYFITYTVKHFGPVVMTIIVSIRQMLSVFVSAIIFQHELTPVAIIAMLMAFFVVITRTVRKPAPLKRSDEEPAPQIPVAEDLTVSQGFPRQTTPEVHSLDLSADLSTLLKCAVAIHVLYCFYALAQEYLATHTFQREVFRYPLFLVASTHTGATLFALCALSLQGVPRYTPAIAFTSLPAAANFIATTFQHWSLYNILFPTQTLMKCMKVVPVMIIGRFLRNRTYTILDYVEGIIITAFVTYFVMDFQLVHSLTVGKSGSVVLGIFLMFGYLVADSFTSPLEDLIFQRHKLDPAQMLLGMELISGTFAWIGLLLSGQLVPAVQFIYANPSIIGPLLELTVAAAAGAYTCTITVRLYGPAVFVLLMMSRQTLSLVISVLAFKHDINIRSCLCLVVVSLVVLMSSLRRVVAQLNARKQQEKQGSGSDTSEKGGTGEDEIQK